MEREDCELIIAWNSNKDFIKVVKDTFGENIILKKEIALTIEERAKKINEIYHPIHVPHNSDRCLYKEPLTVFLVKMEPNYKYYWRTEGYLLCNINIIDFKTKNRKTFDYKIFHCSDSVEEAKKALKVLGLEEHLPKYSIIHVDDIINIRHLKDETYHMVPLKDSVSVQYLIGYDVPFMNQKYNLIYADKPDGWIVKPGTMDYIKSIEDFNQSSSICKVEGYLHDNKCIITDGKHRAANLYFKGDRHIFVHETQAPCSDEIINKSLVDHGPNSHLENLHDFIYQLNNSKIKFVVVRGHRTMPKTADTDLDIVVHPDDYQRFLDLMNKFIKDGKFAFNVEVPYKHPTYQAWYRAFRTLGIFNDFLTNKGYQFDTYNHVFFFSNNKEAFLLSNEFLDYLFNTKQMSNHLFVPNNISEMILLFCRTYIDLNGKWKAKHRKIFDELKKEVSKNQFMEMLSKATTTNYQKLIDAVQSTDPNVLVFDIK